MKPDARLMVVVVCFAWLISIQSARCEVASYERMAELTFESTKPYEDPFKDVEVDVIFSDATSSWRVPTFWRGGQRWTVRFAPTAPGAYTYRLESTDPTNPDLNGREGRVHITAYRGSSEPLRRGPLRVSANKRYFEYADGTPFQWLGDTWWTGLSDRLSWEGFQQLTADRKTKGFTLVQIVAGLVPYEELAPVDPGFRNEGGPVWEPQFARLNPKYFDYADRRIQHLLEAGLVPAIVGGWQMHLSQMGLANMKRHWRHVIARYGAYPVFWIVGGEIADLPEAAVRKIKALYPEQNFDIQRGWTDVARYVRATDPYHHPVTIHELWPGDPPLQDESLLDFRLLHPGHFGWSSINVEVAQLGAYYARRAVTQPLVVGEIGYERLGAMHLEDYQRIAFWLGMLNGAAGHTYGATAVFEAYTADKPFHRIKISLRTWEEDMHLPGSYQLGMGAKLLRQYPWWRFAPHPEWISPRGTTFFEPREDAVNQFHLDLAEEWTIEIPGRPTSEPRGEWTARKGTFRLPYAAGIPGEVRLIYLPPVGLAKATPPTIFALEPDARYHAYYWEPSQGIKVDLGAVARPAPGQKFREDGFDARANGAWRDERGKSVRERGRLTARGEVLTILRDVHEKNLVAAVDADGAAEAGLLLRYQDADNYLAAIHCPAEKALYLIERTSGAQEATLGRTPVESIGTSVRLRAELREGSAIASVSDGERTYTTPIVTVRSEAAGAVGLLHRQSSAVQRFDNFELRHSPVIATDEALERKLYDANGTYRGELKGPATPSLAASDPHPWDSYGRHKKLLLDAYLPERPPTAGDWVLVLDAHQGRDASRRTR